MSGCNRGAFVPRVSGEDLVNDCCRAVGGTKTVGSPTYTLTVTNPSGTDPASCIIVVENEEFNDLLEPLTDGGQTICAEI
jgi:hypothetical protein